MVYIEGCRTIVDLLLLNVLDFDVILGIDWLSLYYVVLEYHAKIVKLAGVAEVRMERFLRSYSY